MVSIQRNILHFAIKSIRFVIKIIERIQSDYTEDKIANSLETSNIEIDTPEGFKPITHVHKTKPFKLYQLLTTSGKRLICADHHLIQTAESYLLRANELHVNDSIRTKDGIEHIKSIELTNSSPLQMYDVTVNTEDHLYYTNDIVSHNTVTTAIFIAWYLCFQSDKNVLILANKLATAAELMDKIKTILKNLPFFLQPAVLVNNIYSMDFDSGCKIKCSATTKTAAIGFTIHLLYMDEFAHIPPTYLDSFYRSVYPTVSASKKSRIIITSTPNGLNRFHDIYTNAVEGKNEYHPIRIDWWQVPGRDEDWRMRQIANFGEEEFNQEYGNQFLAGSKLLLESKALKMLERVVKKYEWKQIDVLDELGSVDDPFDYRGLTWHPKYDLDNIHNHTIVMCVDLSRGLGQDYQVINIFQLVPMTKNQIDSVKVFRDERDFFNLLQVGIYRDNKSEIKDVASIVYELTYHLMNPERVKVIYEVNIGGGEFYNALETFYGNANEFDPSNIVHYKHTEKALYWKPGIKIHRGNKVLMAKNSADLVQRRRIILTEFNSFQEMSTFGLNKKGTSYESQLGHDDIAMTVVTASTIFDNPDYSDLVEEVFDSQPASFRDYVTSKIDEYGGDSDDMGVLLDDIYG